MDKSAFDHFPTLYTDRLILRRLFVQDAKDVFEILSNEQAMIYYGLYPVEHIGIARWFIEQYLAGFTQKRIIRWAIVEKNTERLIGTCGFQGLNETASRSEIGYELHPDYWGRGYMQEALSAIIKWGFNDLKLNRIEALIYPENLASANTVLRLGFTKEGRLMEYAYFRDKYTDLDLFRLLKREFLEQ